MAKTEYINLSRLTVAQIVARVRHYGVLAFLRQGDWSEDQEADIAAAATKAISELDAQVLQLTSFFSCTPDDSYDEITYGAELGGGRYGRLTRTIKYKSFDDAPRAVTVTYGPIVRREQAERLVALLNELHRQPT